MNLPQPPGADQTPPRELPPQELLAWAIRTYGRDFAITTSFQPEGLAIIDMAVSIDPAVRVITLDTGRLPQETYEVMERVRERYGVAIEMVSPAAGELETMTSLHGPNLFYRDPALRKLCCQVRKVRPLERKLAGVRCYATGLRRVHSDERADTPVVQHDGPRLKLNPLAAWTDAELEAYVAARDVPRHPLTAAGFTSIGCAPCTRPTAPGEHPRAGRWWWEQDGSQECGLHVTPEGRMRRTLDLLLDDILVRS